MVERRQLRGGGLAAVEQTGDQAVGLHLCGAPAVCTMTVYWMIRTRCPSTGGGRTCPAARAWPYLTLSAGVRRIARNEPSGSTRNGSNTF